jgi:zinc protease
MTKGKDIALQLLRASCALGLACSVLIIAAQAQNSERITSVEGVTEYRLPNGLRVLLFPDLTKQTITVNMTYLVGSRHENYGETGMAHLLEHLVFKGTPKHPNIPQELTERGTRPNGTTTPDHTNYYETFAATEENLRWALDLEADRMVNSFIAKKHLDSEFSVVLNEYESGENSPFGALIKRMMEAGFAWHNYGKSTIGERSDIENVNIERLQAFYKLYYQPDNAALMIAGKFDEAKALELVKQYFGSIPKPARELPKLYTVEPEQDGERAVTVRRVGDIQCVGLVYHIPAGPHPDYAAIQTLGLVLADMTSGRLHKAMVETGKAVSIANFQFQTYDPGASLLFAYVPKDVRIEGARDAMLQTIDDLTKNPPTAEEVERARQKLLKGIELQLNNSDNIGLNMSEYIAMGDWRLYFLRRDRVRKVTPEDVKRVAAAYFKPSNRTVGLFIPTPTPDRAEIPPRPDVAAMLKDYKGDTAAAMGEEFDPSPANIDARTTRSTAAGLKLALLPKKTRGGKVVARLTLRFGNENDLTNKDIAATLAGEMLMRGTNKHTREQIQDELDQLKARANVFGSATQAGATIETTRENLPAVMRLIAEILREPSFPAKEFELIKQDEIAGVENGRSEPTLIAFNAFSRRLRPYPKGHIDYVRTIDEEIADVKAVRLEDVRKFHSDFYGADHGELAVIGDFDEKGVAKLAGELFGGWKSSRPFARIRQVYFNVEPINKSFEAPDKANAFFLAGVNLNLRDDDPEYPALVLGNFMLGGGIMNSRLAVRIRQKEGVSYSVSSTFIANEFDKSGSFIANAIYAPQNAAKLESAFKEELARALKDGFTADEVEKAKSGWLKSREVSRAQDNELAGALAIGLYLNRTLAWDAELEMKVGALTPEGILTAMRKHIAPAKLTIIKAGDFAKAAQKQASN